MSNKCEHFDPGRKLTEKEWQLFAKYLQDGANRLEEAEFGFAGVDGRFDPEYWQRDGIWVGQRE